MQSSVYYHIYNHANGKDNLFIESRNYHYFLRKWKNYISPIADTFAYCLMPNHFHFLIRVHNQEIIRNLLIKKSTIKTKETTENLLDSELDMLISKYISQQFSNLFSGYTKAINKAYKRYGSLFAPNFKRKVISSEHNLYNVLAYIHSNPIIHGFENELESYLFNSLNSYNSDKTWINTKLMHQRFHSYDKFRQWHDEYLHNRLSQS